ncbi:ATP-dependent DNA helicase [Anaerosporobacter faecicola]|uniref:ATP-dependent DNA helicase n=1 Tax=Anaerosporobacter faecicola TaxID=2718714 RepID=UPI001439923A|nr:ATP-dependent DNA helicase [Anaerosporobacter faecicola]
MYKIVDHVIKVSVRNLVEFILRSGNIDNTQVMNADADAMQEGSRIHRKIQKRMGSEYQAEVPLSITTLAFTLEEEYSLCVEGRADGVIHTNVCDDETGLEKNIVIIDEIKAIYMDLSFLKEAFSVHKAQAMCYAYIVARQEQLDQIQVRMSYCNIETEQMKYFEEDFTFSYLEQWFLDLTAAFSKWLQWQCSWREERNASIKGVEFPFPYREGQRELVTGVYRTIIRNKKLYIEAPTGVGKTISTVYPAVKAMGEGFSNKIFYMTAKTITRTAAQDTFSLLSLKGMRLKVTTITAKDKFCILEKPDCNPGACERAEGHYDRVNDAVYDLITHEDAITRELILSYAAKHRVCPFEMCLDVTNWSDAVICDYNYVFDPNVYLRRFFANETKNDYIFLVDEAHNLVERAREMYSAQLFKQHFLDVKKIVSGYSKKMSKRLDACNSSLLKLKRACEECEVVENIGDLVLHLMRLVAEYEEFLVEWKNFEGRDRCLELYLQIRHFMNMHELLDEHYLIYSDYDEMEGFRVRLQCMNPTHNLANCLAKGKSAIFFSATLLPIAYYKDQLAGSEEDYAIYAPSPFDKERRLLVIGNDVSTKYTRRNRQEYEKIATYIQNLVNGKIGNYMVFFPSYQLLKEVAGIVEERKRRDEIQADVDIQHNNMTEQEKEQFLEDFVENPTRTRIGLCVMGGIFSEGIDLRSNRLIGVIIVGTGLPMVCNERELFRNYYEQYNGHGFDYAYLYNGMNKVLQSAGRVIRTQEDRGIIVLLDERFTNRQYQNLFPREWFPHEITRTEEFPQLVQKFWCETP